MSVSGNESREGRFRVALSFPGAYRSYVREVDAHLTAALGPEAVFYDDRYRPELAHGDLDIHLQNVFAHQAELIALFLCRDYAQQEWCGLGWPALHGIISRRCGQEVLPFRFDDAHVPGLFPADGYIDAGTIPPQAAAHWILKRLEFSRGNVTAAGPPTGPPGLSALAAPSARHQLPRPPPDFTGRVRQLDQLHLQIRSGGAPILGVCGPGGIGKTALALRLARELNSSFPDAQVYLDLKAAGLDHGNSAQPLTPEQALAHVIRAYHPAEKLPEDCAGLVALYQSVLHDQSALLLLDNAAGADQIAPLIPPAGCRLLITSRRRLSLPGLYTLDLDALAAEDAAAFLLKLAPRIGVQSGLLADLCDRLPLALRLAGSALVARDTLTTCAYIKKLRDTKARLAALDKCLAEIGLALGIAAALELSYHLLGVEHQVWWRMLAVFPATFDASAAQAIWDLPQGEALEKLGDLWRYGLIAHDPRTDRFHLHDLPRALAQARLMDNERALAEGRLAEKWTALAGRE